MDKLNSSNIFDVSSANSLLQCPRRSQNLDKVKVTILTMAQDWDEIKKLAADLQRAQLGGTIQKLSERNCIEIVNYLVSNGFLKVIYTTDGKEYLTHKQLER